MKKIYITVVAAIIGINAGCVNASPPLDAKQYIAQRGWRANPVKAPAIPASDITTVSYFDKESSVPSCGLLSQGTGAPVFIDVLKAPADDDYPHCVLIQDAAAFELNKKNYLVFEYISRDTREDLYRGWFFVYKDVAGGYVPDRELNASDAADDETVYHNIGKITPRAAEGARRAKAFMIGKSLPGSTFLKRDFVADGKTSLAVFHDKTNSKCTFVVDAGAEPARIGHETFAGSDKCASFLATGKLEKDSSTYYIALFKGAARNHLGVISVKNNTTVTPEKRLALAASNNGKVATIKEAKAALEKALN